MKTKFIFATLLMGLTASAALQLGEKTILKACESSTAAEIYQTKADGEDVTVMRCSAEKKLYVLKQGYENVGGEYKKSTALTVVEVLNESDVKARYFDQNSPEAIRVASDMKVIYQSTADCASQAFVLQRIAVRKGGSTSYKYHGPFDSGICVSADKNLGKGASNVVAMKSTQGSSTVVFDIGRSFLILGLSSQYDFDNGASPVQITEAKLIEKPTLACGQNILEVHLTAAMELLLFQENNKIQRIDLESEDVSLVKEADYLGASTCHGRSISLYNQRSGTILVNEKIRQIQRVTTKYDQPTGTVDFKVTKVNY